MDWKGQIVYQKLILLLQYPSAKQNKNLSLCPIHSKKIKRKIKGDLLKELYDLLPDIILYLAIGFVYLKVYKFTSIVPTVKNISEILIESLIAGFVLKCIYDLFPPVNFYIDALGMIISSALIGFVSAKLFSSRFFDKILTFLDIRQTKSQFIWQDILGDTPIWITAIDYEKEIFYYGKVVLVESYEKEPKVLITEYKYMTDKKQIDNTNNPGETVLIDTSKFQDIWISYVQDEEKVKSWRLDGDPPTTIYNVFPRIWQKLKYKHTTKFNKK